MRVLLDTNIVIHREASRVVVPEIGILFNWLDRLHHTKYVHPVTIAEINKLKDKAKRNTFNVKLASYEELVASSALHSDVAAFCSPLDHNENDSNDTLLINEVYSGCVDLLISEDKKIKRKSELLGIADKVQGIAEFLAKTTGENPEFSDYKVLSVRKEYFANIDINDQFFDSFREDYPEFEDWFKRKSQEEVYISKSGDQIIGFLYLKVEDRNEAYPEFEPVFSRKKRLKIGTFKTRFNRSLLGERLLKIAFDNAVRHEVEEIYVTIFDGGLERQWLIKLLEDYGFVKYGIKRHDQSEEAVYARDIGKAFNQATPKLTYPYISKQSRSFIVPIYPEYHTNLFPDSILRTESPSSFVENHAYRNSISKVYISRSRFSQLVSGDLIVFYRTGGIYKSVISTIGIVENVITNIPSSEEFIRLCRKRSVFTDQELLQHWNYFPNLKPFIVNFLYAYSFPKRINMHRLIKLGIIRDVNSAPRGFELLTAAQMELILEETQTDERIIVN